MGRALAVLLVVYILSDVLLTPLGGLETRPSADVTTVGFITVSLFFVGLALSVVSLVLLFYKPRRSPIVGIIAGILYFPVFIADQSGYFSSLQPPTAIAALEIVQALVALVTIFLASSLYRAKTAKQIGCSALC
jgi:hypothetical protein